MLRTGLICKDTQYIHGLIYRGRYSTECSVHYHLILYIGQVRSRYGRYSAQLSTAHCWWSPWHRSLGSQVDKLSLHRHTTGQSAADPPRTRRPSTHLQRCSRCRSRRGPLHAAMQAASAAPHIALVVGA